MFSVPSSCDDLANCLPQSAHIVWQITRPARLARHAGRLCSGSAPFGPDDRDGSRRRPECEAVGCTDLFLDVWIESHAAMHVVDRRRAGDGGLANPMGYLTTAARGQLAELQRRERVRRGGVAKPQRTDGTIGRICRSLDDLWQVDMFRFLLGYAAVASSSATPALWPVDALTVRKNLWDGADRVPGDATARCEIRRDLDRLLTTVREIAGPAWLFSSLIQPMTNRTAATPEDYHDREERHDDDRALGALAEDALAEMLRRSNDGARPSAALAAAVADRMGDLSAEPSWTRIVSDELALRRLATTLVTELRARECAA